MKLWKVVTFDRKSICMNRSFYIRTYRKGKVVKKARGSIGILCFKTLRSAQRFLCGPNGQYGAKIIKVKSIGRCSYPKWIIMGWEGAICKKRWYEMMHLLRTHPNNTTIVNTSELLSCWGFPPSNTVACPAVRVIT